jgi:hypothetical protein
MSIYSGQQQQSNPAAEQRERQQRLIQNIMQEMYYKFTVLCVDICQTAKKEELEMEDKVCLQNCGYNRTYINKVYTDMQMEILGLNNPNQMYNS